MILWGVVVSVAVVIYAAWGGVHGRRAREKQRRVVCGPAGTDHHIQPRRCFIRFGEGSLSLVKP
jgi:hypothetical protein